MVYTLDPIRDPRWAEFIASHRSSSVFHTPEWLEAVRRSYGYVPVVYTTTPPSSPLTNGIVFCQIESWLTGRRMVSLPFSDHCEPLIDTPGPVEEILEALKNLVDSGKWKYVEVRPLKHPIANGDNILGSSYCFHMLDLSPSLEQIFRLFHKDCVQRKIRRAEREAIEYQSGISQDLLNAFYRLMVKTRRKHQLPPQPIQWFRNLVECMGDKLRIRVTFKDQKEIAGILTLQYQDVIVYKYGASDPEFQNLGGTPLLFWKTIEEAKATGISSMDLGRSDLDNDGLIVFKDRLGAASTQLKYQRWSRETAVTSGQPRSFKIAKELVAKLPDSMLKATGRLIYRHIG